MKTRLKTAGGIFLVLALTTGAFLYGMSRDSSSAKSANGGISAAANVTTDAPPTAPQPQVVQCADRGFAKGETFTAGAGCHISGDVTVNGAFRGSGKADVGTIVDCRIECQVSADNAGGISGRPVEEMKAEMLAKGCSNGCSDVIIVTIDAAQVSSGNSGNLVRSFKAQDLLTFNFVTTFRQGAWTVKGTNRLAQNPIVDAWIKRLRDPQPAVWTTFPNIPNPDVPEFRVVACNTLPGNSRVDPSAKCVPWGMEYGTYNSPFCSSHPCDVPIGAWEYRLITGDYHALNYECRGDKSKGCLLLILNVMNESVTIPDQDALDGFTLRGRYFDGDNLEWGVWGLVSHASANLLNMPTLAHPGEILNSGVPGNSGANCGTPQACATVDVRVIVLAGDTPIAVLETTVARTGGGVTTPPSK